MRDIAKAAGITRVSLYRYFPDCHPITFGIAVRMLTRIYESLIVEETDSPLQRARKMMFAAIDQFYELRDAYRFLGMFDHLYGASYPTEEMAALYKEGMAIPALSTQNGANDITPEQLTMIGNCVMSFLQRLAARGDLMAEEQGVPLRHRCVHNLHRRCFLKRPKSPPNCQQPSPTSLTANPFCPKSLCCI